MDGNNPQQHNPGSLPQPILNAPSADNPAGPASPQQVDVPPPQTSMPQLSQPQAPTPLGQASQVANDSDSIDAAWLARVDTVIKQTVVDPRVMSQEFAKLKAEYIAGRYGREIKQADRKG